jgi:hypothetical protein
MSSAKVDSKISIALGARVIRRDGTVEEPFAVRESPERAAQESQRNETDAAPPSHPVEEG